MRTCTWKAEAGHAQEPGSAPESPATTRWGESTRRPPCEAVAGRQKEGVTGKEANVPEGG